MNKREKIKILDNDTELFNKLKDKNTAIKFMELIPYETEFNGIVERLISYKERSNGEIISLEMILRFIRPNNSFNEHAVGNMFEMTPLFRIVFTS